MFTKIEKKLKCKCKQGGQIRNVNATDHENWKKVKCKCKQRGHKGKWKCKCKQCE